MPGPSVRPAPASLRTAVLTAIALAAPLLPVPAFAQAALTETLTPGPRPYPYRILDIQPGASSDDAVSMFQERMAIVMVPEEVQVRVQSPEGREIEFTYPQRMMTQGVGIYASRGSEPYVKMQTTLATPVMGNRVTAISRSERGRTAEMPSPAALRAQVEGLYGTPSKVDMDAGTMRLTWAWGEDGFIPDLDAVAEKTMTFDPGDGTAQTLTYRPCQDTYYDFQYRFEQVRRSVIAPGCVATFDVTFRGGATLSDMGFSLEDHDLARQSRAETDRQIVKALTGDAPLEASDVDL